MRAKLFHRGGRQGRLRHRGEEKWWISLCYAIGYPAGISVLTERQGYENAYAKHLPYPAAATAFGVARTPSPAADAEGRPSLLSDGGGLLMLTGRTAGGIFEFPLRKAVAGLFGGACRRLLWRPHLLEKGQYPMRKGAGSRGTYNSAIGLPGRQRRFLGQGADDDEVARLLLDSATVT